MEHVLFQRSDGSFDLILWIEKSAYDAEAHTMTPISPESVQLTVESKFRASRVVTIDGDGSVESRNLPEATPSLAMTVGDRPSILRIVPR